MKKNISINISGIIFHIEEDGYDTLRKYLDSINSYFGTFEDSSEILADIESRIAEIFLSKLNDGKQIITAEDVQSLTATMGSVNDFKAAEAEESEGAPKEKKAEPAFSEPSASKPHHGTKRLVRDQKRKILGGVCAAFGNYFSIDAVWPRILFVLLAVGTYGVFIVVYIVLWIALPFSADIDEEPSVKKMYRDPDNKVIGGVAAGIAAFFGTDTVLIRILFGISVFFFGTGILLYIILWAVLPEAKTITDKMKMQGEPVTLSNIESSVKKSLNEKDDAEESTLAKILLFPFRIVATVLQGIFRILGPIFLLMIDICRVAIGLIFSVTGVMFIITLIAVTGIMLGVFHFDTLHIGQVNVSGANFPLDAVRRAFPFWTILFAFFAALIPAVIVLLIGNSIIRKRNILRGITGWTLFILFFVSIAFLSIRIPQLVYTFKEEGEVKEEKIFTIAGTPLLKLKETGLNDYDFTNLSIKGYDGKEVKLIERFGAQGITRGAARANAREVTYNVVQQDSVILFDSNLSFKADSKFNFQRLDLDLMVPYNKPFAIDPDMRDFIQNHWIYGFSSTGETQTFRIVLDEKSNEGRMECVSCPPPGKDLSGIGNDDQFGLKDFKEIEMTGVFDVVIRRGDAWAIKMEGSDVLKRQYTLNVDGETLEITNSIRKKSFWKDLPSDPEMVTITIEMPDLENLKITGAGKVKVTGFNEQELKMALLGAMVVDARIDVRQLYVDASGPIIFEVDGDGDFMEITASNTAQVKASSFSINHAIVEATSLSQVRVNARETVEIDKDISSTVKYTGNPQVVKKD